MRTLMQSARARSGLARSALPAAVARGCRRLHVSGPCSEKSAEAEAERANLGVHNAIHERVEGLFSEIKPLAKEFNFLNFSGDDQSFNKPMVLLLGNHSSGKSSFINYLLGEDLQKTGVATTDDGFTIIAGGKSNEEVDGPSSPKHPFRALVYAARTLKTAGEITPRYRCAKRT